MQGSLQRFGNQGLLGGQKAAAALQLGRRFSAAQGILCLLPALGGNGGALLVGSGGNGGALLIGPGFGCGQRLLGGGACLALDLGKDTF